MSTNATIIRKVEEDKYEAIYLHWDGYPSEVMKHLPNYNTVDELDELFDEGDCSILASNLADCQFYRRDRGESDEIASQTFADLDECRNYYGNGHNYLWDAAHEATSDQGHWRIV